MKKIKDMDYSKLCDFLWDYWKHNSNLTFKQFCEGIKDYKEEGDNEN